MEKKTGTNPGFKSEKPRDHYLWDWNIWSNKTFTKKLQLKKLGCTDPDTGKSSLFIKKTQANAKKYLSSDILTRYCQNIFLVSCIPSIFVTHFFSNTAKTSAAEFIFSVLFASLLITPISYFCRFQPWLLLFTTLVSDRSNLYLRTS